MALLWSDINILLLQIYLKETPGTVLNAVDGENHQFIDILIENEQKMVISEYVVQVEELSIVVSVKISRKIRVFRFEFLLPCKSYPCAKSNIGLQEFLSNARKL